MHCDSTVASISRWRCGRPPVCTRGSRSKPMRRAHRRRRTRHVLCSPPRQLVHRFVCCITRSSRRPPCVSTLSHTTGRACRCPCVQASCVALRRCGDVVDGHTEISDALSETTSTPASVPITIDSSQKDLKAHHKSAHRQRQRWTVVKATCQQSKKEGASWIALSVRSCGKAHWDGVS